MKHRTREEVDHLHHRLAVAICVVAVLILMALVLLAVTTPEQ